MGTRKPTAEVPAFAGLASFPARPVKTPHTMGSLVFTGPFHHARHTPSLGYSFLLSFRNAMPVRTADTVLVFYRLPRRPESIWFVQSRSRLGPPVACCGPLGR